MVDVVCLIAGNLKGDKIVMTKEKSKASNSEIKKTSKKRVAKKAKVTKKAVAKKVTAKATKSTTPKPKNRITPEERLEMIRTAAYFLAEKRGYQGSDELGDWFEAEREIDSISM
jgi:Na+-translocating ferredoxin:NAD+ oxidoreductase RnfG subunit